MPAPPPDLRQILDTLPVSVVRLNKLLQITYANAHICSLLGRTGADVLGRTCIELGMCADQWGPWDDTLRKVFQTGLPATFEYLSTLKGTERFVQYRFTPEPGPDGGVSSVLVMAITNDEVHRLRAALHERKAMFDAFMDNGPMIAWMRDSSTRYVYLNQTYLKHYGIAADSILGKKLGERWPAEVAERFVENDQKVIAADRAIQVYEFAPEADGINHTWLNIKFPFTDSTGERYIGGVGIDVTDRVRAEQEKRDLERQLLHAQKMESLGVLAGGLAHDFNNLLSVILGNVGLGLRNLRSDAPAADHLRQIEQAADRAADLCRQMLAYAGRGRLVIRDLDLSDIAQDTATMLTTVVPLNVRLESRFPPHLPPVRGDASQLRQVVMNLLTNAIDAVTGAGGSVTVSTEAVTVCRGDLADAELARTLPPGRYVALQVTDSGVGMDEGTLARIFDPFFTTKPAGRGLGLAAVQGVARGHRGGVSVVSRPGQGSTFRVLLPVAGTADLTDIHGAEGVPSRFGRARTVLVVDADEESRRLVRATLDRVGFAVLTADPGNAADAIRRLPGQVAAAVVDPAGWPGGAEAAIRQLREARDELPVLLATGGPNLAVGLPRGAVAGHVRKPLRVADLLEMVFDVVGP